MGSMRNVCAVILLLFLFFGCKMTTWEEKTSDVYWDVIKGVWDGEKWVGELEEDKFVVEISVKGAWAVDYRPEYIKVTWVGSSPTLSQLYMWTDTEDHIMQNSFESGVSYIFTGKTSDFLYFKCFEFTDNFGITKIEFGFDSDVKQWVVLSDGRVVNQKEYEMNHKGELFKKITNNFFLVH